MTLSPQAWAAVLVGVAATVEDLAHRRISNWIPLCALLAGFACQSAERGWRGVLAAAAGTACGFAVFLVFYLLGGMGGGDIKLMAGFGALLGTGKLLEAAFWTAAVGGLMAVAVLAGSALANLFRKGARTRVTSIPYAPAISLGVWLSLAPKG